MVTYLYSVDIRSINKSDMTINNCEEYQDKINKYVTKSINYFRGQFTDKMHEEIHVVGIPIENESTITLLSQEIIMDIEHFIPCEVSKNNTISKIGQFYEFSVFVNYEQNDSIILLGRTNNNPNSGDIVIVENKITMDEKNIYWTGKIDKVSDNSKYNYDIIRVDSINNLSWYKKILYKWIK